MKYDLIDQTSIENFILREITVKPEIGKTGTFFQLSDEEVKLIKGKIDQGTTEVEAPDLLEALGIEKILIELKEKLDKVDISKASDDEKSSLERQVKQLERVRENYSRLTGEWETPKQEIDEMENDRDNGMVSYEEFSVLRVRRIISFAKGPSGTYQLSGTC